MGMTPEQEMQEKNYNLASELRRAEKEVKEYLTVRAGIGYVVFGLLMFYHLDGWLESNHVIGFRQWLYIIPFFVVIALLGLWLAHEGIQLEMILKRQK